MTDNKKVSGSMLSYAIEKMLALMDDKADLSDLEAINSKPLYITTLTYDSSTNAITVDKTIDEIIEAYNNGIELVLKDTLTNESYTKLALLGNINIETPTILFVFAHQDSVYSYSYENSAWTYQAYDNDYIEALGITVTDGTVKITDEAGTAYTSITNMGFVVLDGSKIVSIMSDTIQFVGSTTGKITGLAAPTADSQAANKAYVDGKSYLNTETWTFTLEDGSTVTKAVYVG